ncbi:MULTISPECIES: signal peptidase I [unclassified Microbacterium]|uniref:signal peptidase I n=1 Tax=unclassified Microbacterium TaxID=2609290 RepID=UPI00214C8553|nr:MULTISPECIES: signal peptidase I [unclassified Microbacterium]MCR2784983.1 signal peptidase I [Microbacterium sp. zg.B96]WIM16522.1 signal peptidase I [Microbacterium sp. zg-B96]
MKVWQQVSIAGIVAVVLGAALAAGSHVTVFRVESASMAPAVPVGDVVVAGRTDGSTPARSDIVVFTDPGEWAGRVARLTGTDEVSPTFVKRVVGLPGERVVCCDAAGRVTVDGVPLAEPYLADPDALASVLAFDVTVPADAVFVLGDNRAASIDSRYLGTVPVPVIVGTLQFTLDIP